MKSESRSRLATRIALVCTALLSALWWAGGGMHQARAATFTVTNCSADDGSAGTLRAVIAAAAAGDTVTFGCDGTLTLTSTLDLTRSMTIDGTGHRVVISGGGRVQVLQIDPSLTVTLNDLTIKAGTCLCWGGGIVNGYQAMLTVTNSDIIDNTSGDGGRGGYGGGIFNGGTLRVSNSSFYNNVAANSGGAIWNNFGTVSVTNSTFRTNYANRDGGGDFAGLGSTTLANTIMADTGGGDCLNGVVDLGGNFADDGTCSLSSISSHNNAAGLNLTWLLDNGGPTGTMALLPGSAAIGAGVSSICNAAPVNGLDQRGLPRGTVACDSGAYDTGANVAWTPTNTPTNTPAPPTNTATSTPAPPRTPLPPTDTPTNTPVPTATPTNTPAPTDTPVPTNTSTRTPVPTNTPTTTPVAGAALVANPTSGTPFQHITVSGATFGPTEVVKIYWDSTASTALASPVTLATGSFTASITVPQAKLGAHTLLAVGQSSARTASAAFQVKPAVYLSPTAGKVGASVTLIGLGFGVGEAVAALWAPGFTVVGSATTNAVGSVVVHIIVPQKAPGAYTLYGYGVTTKAAAGAPFTVTP